MQYNQLARPGERRPVSHGLDAQRLNLPCLLVIEDGSLTRHTIVPPSPAFASITAASLSSPAGTSSRRSQSRRNWASWYIFLSVSVPKRNWPPPAGGGTSGSFESRSPPSLDGPPWRWGRCEASRHAVAGEGALGSFESRSFPLLGCARGNGGATRLKDAQRDFFLTVPVPRNARWLKLNPVMPTIGIGTPHHPWGGSGGDDRRVTPFHEHIMGCHSLELECTLTPPTATSSRGCSTPDLRIPRREVVFLTVIPSTQTRRFFLFFILIII